VAKRRIRIDLQYDGSGFVGWQRQPNAPSVQGALERAFEIALHRKIAVTGAGRTDAGVHALGQVAHADIPGDTDLHRLFASLNALTPDGVAVSKLRWAARDFDARRSATLRTYRFRVAPGPVAYERQYVWSVRKPLDYRLLRDAAEALPGRHDFVSFCVAGSARKGTVCRVQSAGWRRQRGELHFTISADRFVHGMVRSLVGTMVEVAAGKMSVADFRRLLRTRDRRHAGPTAPAHGLCLLKVKYARS